jgi:hypothetical protein
MILRTIILASSILQNQLHILPPPIAIDPFGVFQTVPNSNDLDISPV